MELNKGVIARLEALLEDLNLSRGRLAEVLEVEAYVIDGIMKGKRKTIPGPLITLLELKYALNPKWLENGIGEMFKQNLITEDPYEILLLEQSRRLDSTNQELLMTVLNSLVASQVKMSKIRARQTKKKSSKLNDKKE